ncbi:MAG: glycosyl hydrolase family 8, partial [Propylenella sp.]
TDPKEEASQAAHGDTLLPKKLWENFVGRFITPEGRVVDEANSSISHSEGQGYGMLLAAFAGDRAIFQRLWAWTETELLVRDDGLAAWRWEPDADPHVTDLNNATDGDILIAWALVEGAERFGDERYRDAAAAMAESIHAHATETGKHGRVLMPGIVGFDADDRRDGPVVNLSYWVFPALPALKRAAPELDWDAVAESGLALLGKSQFGERHLPTDWIALGGEKPRPANGFPPSFAYNAIRIPLYLAWGQAGERKDMAPFMALWSDAAAIQTIDVHSGEAVEEMKGAGYRVVAALVACAMEGQPIPGQLRETAPDDSYYPTVLQALSLIAAEEVFSGCR